MTTVSTTVTYFIQSRPHPAAPWERRPAGLIPPGEPKDTALQRLADRRAMQPGWEHRLMEQTTTITERPPTEET